MRPPEVEQRVSEIETKILAVLAKEKPGEQFDQVFTAGIASGLMLSELFSDPVVKKGYLDNCERMARILGIKLETIIEQL